jgi:hypothetical protein
MLTARTLELSMYAYAQDHGGRYPDGKSSTEVFQKLVDGQYVPDPAYFYSKMAGKTPATSKRLLPENVSWDVTIPVDAKSADEIPVIFCTGFRIDYKPGGSAIPLAGQSRPYSCGDGITVCYHSHSSHYRIYAKDEPGVVENFIPADTKLGTNSYTQLTPDGPLPAQ